MSIGKMGITAYFLEGREFKLLRQNSSHVNIINSDSVPLTLKLTMNVHNSGTSPKWNAAIIKPSKFPALRCEHVCSATRPLQPAVLPLVYCCKTNF